MADPRKQAAHKLGLTAEDAAADYLQQRGYTILAKRHRTFSGEIDLVAEDDDTLVIVEVKARKKLDDGLYSITTAKQKRLIQAAQALLAEPEKIAGLDDAASRNIRFDVVIITPGHAPTHLINAFSAEGDYGY